ncbi:hypothetical protein [Halioxenophilus aromaticivorans]
MLNISARFKPKTKSPLAPRRLTASIGSTVAGAVLCLLAQWAAPSLAAPAMVNLDDQRFLIKDDDANLAKLSLVGYGKGYQWLNRPKPTTERLAQGEGYRYGNANAPLRWYLGISSQGEGIAINAEVDAKRNVALEYLGLQLEILEPGQFSHLMLTNSSGKNQKLGLPLAKGEADGITQVTLVDKNNQSRFSLAFKQPASVHMDRSLRIKMIAQSINAQQSVTNQYTLSFPQPGKFYADISQHPVTSQHNGWYAFTPKSSTSASEFDMSHWLQAPKKALTSDGGNVLINDKPAKIWGTNVEYAAVAPSHRDAEQRAAFFAKYGINGVRLHKLTNPGWEGLGTKRSASEFAADKLEKFDFFTAELGKHNITYTLSPIWDLKIFPGDKNKLTYYDELAKVGHTRGAVWFAKDVQDLHIETMVNLLTHKNQYTGLTYAEDPNHSFFEIQNESDIFFYTTDRFIQRSPSYKKMFAEQFSQWLKQRYGGHSGLVKAWGRGAIDGFKGKGAFADEHLDKNNIYPAGNPWFWDNQINDSRLGKRLQDTAQFLLETQNNYYRRAVEAIRATGFKGEIVTSNWQAGSGPAHLLNLYSDASFGMVDRHNYMGGADGPTQHKLMPGYTLKNDTMLPKAGSRLLSTGMQQMKDKPFVVSEWLVVPPAEWAAADTTIMAAYGMGLQGWDMSYHFVSNGNGFTGTLNFPREKKFNNLTPVGVGLYPILSRMVLRGDVTPGEVIATRRLTPEQARTGSYDFTSTSVQTQDLKGFDGTPSQKALAVGQVLIEFTDKPTPSTIGDWQKYRKGKTIHSTTGQLKWTEGDTAQSGFIEINTAGTQGVAGFTGKQGFNFDDLSITNRSPYGVILATAQGQNKTLANDDGVLLVAMSRAHNTGMSFDKDLIISVGQAPTLLEPVKAEVSFKRTPKRITVLDHDGQKTGATVPLKDGKVQLDTGRDKSPYYLVEF